MGELPDAADYGDVGSNTFGHTAEAVGGLDLPNLQSLGLGNIIPIQGVPPVDSPRGFYGKMAELSPGKDTTTGHWEIAGVVLDKPFPLYPDGFAPEIIDAFEAAVGRSVIGNCPASGLEMIRRFGPEHVRTGCPIVYTSADSVFQIACHEETVPVDELYHMCLAARRLLVGPHGVARVIARPFAGAPGAFYRTGNRKDFSLEPPYPTLLDRLIESGREVVAIGKIEDIFAGRGITRAIHSVTNAEGVAAALEAITQAGEGLIFANLVDFDTRYAHRNDPRGFAQALEEFDRSIPDILDAMSDDDTLIITADHGCDPTTPGYDHTREYAPILVFRPCVTRGADLGARRTFADIAATILDAMNLPPLSPGASFWPNLRPRDPAGRCFGI